MALTSIHTEPRVLAARAISSLYIREILKPIFVATIGISVAFTGIVLYLSIAWSAWWLILLVITILISLALILIMTTVLVLASKLAPAMNGPQRTAAKAYVKNIHEVSDTLQTPQFLIVFNVIIDLYKRRWQDGFIQRSAASSAKLGKDFSALVTLFS